MSQTIAFGTLSPAPAHPKLQFAGFATIFPPSGQDLSILTNAVQSEASAGCSFQAAEGQAVRRTAQTRSIDSYRSRRFRIGPALGLFFLIVGALATTAWMLRAEELGKSANLPGYDTSDKEDIFAHRKSPSVKQVDALTATELAARIDELLNASWQRNHIAPAPATSDAEFVRRIYLDLIGRIPSVAETLAFFDDARADKRRQLVDELLERGAWAAHFANTWRDLLLAGSANPELRSSNESLDNWLRLRFGVNMPYDKIAQELLTADARTTPEAGEPSAAAFYLAAANKPEQLAASSSRVFLGIQLQCAQCHNHPFAKWKREQFWQFAAFFKDAAMEPVNPSAPAVATLTPIEETDGLKIPDTEIVVKATFLDGSSPEHKSGESKRDVLARWISSNENPLFAEAAVNRLWDNFFGRGLVSPVDHLDTSGPASQPQLFDELAEQFVLHNYDLKYLIRAITSSRAYQLSSQGVADQSDRQLAEFARMPLRRMSGDQLYASFVQATGFAAESPSRQQGLLDQTARDDFETRFSDTSVPRTEAQTTILQALALMNGKYVADATDLKQSRVFAAIADAPYLDTHGRIEMLYLTALSRRPEESEFKQLSDYVGAAAKSNQSAALADVFWSLLNSAEFVLNH
jgi:Protein of unknown function (DUF1549)/Protein of unknown function (DUF1553)